MTYANQELMIEISQKLAKKLRFWNANEQYVFDNYLGKFIRLYMGITGRAFTRDAVKLNTYLRKDLHMDTADIFECMMLIEKGFGFVISNENINKVITGDICINSLCKLIIESYHNHNFRVTPETARSKNVKFDTTVIDRYADRKMQCVANEIKDCAR